MSETQQRTDDWYKARRGKLTASNLGGLLGLVSWTPRKEAYERVLGQEQNARKPENWYGNRACEWGTTHEVDGILDYMTKTGNLVNATGLHTHPTIPWIAGSPDGFIGHEGLIEVKCPYYQKRDGSSRVHKKIPIYYYLQINALLEITQRQWCDYVCWTPEGCAMFRVQRDKDTFDWLMQYYQQIYAAVRNLMPAPPHLSVQERAKIKHRVEEAMERTVDLSFWSAAVLSTPPAIEDSDTSVSTVEDEDEVSPAKRLCVSAEGSGSEVSGLVSSRTRQAIRRSCGNETLADVAKALQAFRYEKVQV